MSKKIRILLICYYFPPLGGAGIGRPLSLFKELGEHGIDCDILTVKPVAYRVYEPEQLTLLDKSRIYRSGSFDPQRLMYLLGMRRIKGKSIERGREISDRFFPDPKVGWVCSAIRYGRQLLTSQKYDLIMSTSPPVSCHLVAQQLSRETTIPWVADFRDYWNAYPVEDCFSNSKLIARGKELIKTIRKEARSVTTVNESIAAYLETDQVISNSYDTDFARLWLRESVPDRFVIGLFGTFNEVYPVRPLFKAVAQLLDQQPQLREIVRIDQIGNTDPNWLDRELEKYGLVDYCIKYGFKSRAEAVILASHASCFYVGVDPEKGAGFSTGKVFYLLASGRPILAAAPPDGELCRLLKKTGNSFCITSTEIESAVKFLHAKIEIFGRGERSFDICPGYAEEYSSQRMTARFATLFNRLLSE
ncbi:MAG: hypothetical protein P1R58_06695 [bacterium]|nr:hypothetical protein [bacterium]